MQVRVKNYAKEQVSLLNPVTGETVFISPAEQVDLDEKYMLNADPRVRIIKRYPAAVAAEPAPAPAPKPAAPVAPTPAPAAAAPAQQPAAAPAQTPAQKAPEAKTGNGL